VKIQCFPGWHGILQREGDCVRPLKVIGKSGEAGDQHRGRFVFGDNDGVRLDDNYLDRLTDTKDKGDFYVFKDIDERLKEKGLFEDAQTHAIKRVIARSAQGFTGWAEAKN